MLLPFLRLGRVKRWIDSCAFWVSVVFIGVATFILLLVLKFSTLLDDHSDVALAVVISGVVVELCVVLFLSLRLKSIYDFQIEVPLMLVSDSLAVFGSPYYFIFSAFLMLAIMLRSTRDDILDAIAIARMARVLASIGEGDGESPLLHGPLATPAVLAGVGDLLRKAAGELDDSQAGWLLPRSSVKMLRQLHHTDTGGLWLADSLISDRPVVVKCLSDGSDQSEAVLDKDAVLSLRNLRHRNVVLFHGVVLLNGSMASVAEYSARGSLQSALEAYSRSDVAIDMPLLLGLVQDALSGVDYLHAQNPACIHGHLHSRNLIVTAEGVAKISDFGTSRLPTLRGGDDGVSLGDLAWQAPELIMGTNLTADGTRHFQSCLLQLAMLPNCLRTVCIAMTSYVCMAGTPSIFIFLVVKMPFRTLHSKFPF